MRTFVFLSLLWISFWFGVLPVSAQTTDDIEVRRAKLQAELGAEDREIAKQTVLLEQKQKEGATLTGEVKLLKSQIKQAELRIKAKKLEIGRLENEIGVRETKVKQLDSRIKREQESLAELLRKTRDSETFSVVEVVFAAEQLTDFFNDIDDFEFIQKSLHRSFAEMRQAQDEANYEKSILEERKTQELDAKKTIEYEQKLVEKREKEKKFLLSVTKNQERTYQEVLRQREKRAAEIRSMLFSLRDTAAIPFGKALEYANGAAAKTGIRSAFLLAVLKQESNLGENVGTCNRPSDPPEKKWRAVMKPSRDQQPFLRITGELGFDPDNMPVSCPWRGGYGGAMGPAQFIPSTWELFKSRIAALVGKPVPNPWEPRDAFMASAFYLADLGAANQSYSAERNAACRYYSGRSCGVGSPPNAFYGNGVMVKAEDIQLNMIDPLRET